MSCPQISWCALEEAITPENLCSSPANAWCTYLETQLSEQAQIPHQMCKTEQHRMQAAMVEHRIRP